MLVIDGEYLVVAGSGPPEKGVDGGRVESSKGEEVGGVEVAVELRDLPDGGGVGVSLGEDGGEKAVIEGGRSEVPDLIGMGEETIADELITIRIQPNQMHLHITHSIILRNNKWIGIT